MKKILCSIIAFFATMPMLAQIEIVPIGGTYQGEIKIGINSQSELENDPGRPATLTIAKSSKPNSLNITSGGFKFAAYTWQKIELKNVKYEITNEGYTFQTEETMFLDAEVIDRQNKLNYAAISISPGAKGTMKNGVLVMEMTFKFGETIILTKFTYDKTATGIGQISREEEQQPAIYDLTGKRVSKPHKGIYIINGKKVIY